MILILTKKEYESIEIKEIHKADMVFVKSTNYLFVCKKNRFDGILGVMDITDMAIYFNNIG